MAAPTPVATGALATTATEASLAVVSPACSIGDCMIALVLNRAGPTNAIDDDGTWTPLSQDAITNITASVWMRTATGSGESFTFTKASDDNNLFAGVIQVYSPAELDATAVGVTTDDSADDDVNFPAFDPTSTENRTIFAAFYANDLTTFAAAMSADTNPDCTIDFDLETSVGGDCTIAVTSGTNDGTAIAARTWASASSADANHIGVVFALVTPAGGGGISVPVTMHSYRQRRVMM